MFTGIIEAIGEINALHKEGDNLTIRITSKLAPELSIDQSLSHNGVCLTVVATQENNYTVTAIKETIDKSNMGRLALGDSVNLERAMRLGDRLDGHIVQGHVDQVAVCTKIVEANGSWYFTFDYDSLKDNITIEKGSITVNGVSLTVVNSEENTFDVAIIPYTYDHTNFNQIKVGSIVNLEFDVIGKYVAKLMTPGS